jgi:hypothetical protein
MWGREKERERVTSLKIKSSDRTQWSATTRIAWNWNIAGRNSSTVSNTVSGI